MSSGSGFRLPNSTGNSTGRCFPSYTARIVLSVLRYSDTARFDGWAIAVPNPVMPLDNLRAFPDHTQLPKSDGTFVKNFQEHPQSILLIDSLESVLKRLHPDGQ